MRHMTTKRSATERKIRKAKAEYVQDKPAICESCGEPSTYLGCSHIISVNDCLYDPRYPKDLAWDTDNLTLECHNVIRHGGLSCHQITEAKSEASIHYKVKQLNLEKKMLLYRQYMPWMAEMIDNYIR